MGILTKCAAICAMTCMAAVQSAEGATITSTFDTDAEGWTENPGEASVAHIPTGGNSGGYLAITDAGVGSVPFGSGAFAPAKFLGDQSLYFGGTLSLDMFVIAGGGGTFGLFGEIQITGAGQTVITDVADTAPFGAWTPYSAALSGATWGVSDATLMAVLGDIVSIGVSTDAFDGADTIGLDNFALTSAAAIPLAPGALFLLTGLAALGLSRRRRLIQAEAETLQR